MSEAGKRIIFHELLTPEETLSKVFSTVKVEPLGTEVVRIEESYGRVLARDVYSRIDVPPFDRATMDGFAVRAEDTFGADELNPVKLRVIGNIETGAEELPQVNSGEAVEIATGAPMPPGANAVVMVEYTKRSGDELVIYRSVTPGENVMSAGSDVMMGELILRKCTVIREREVGLLAAVGIDRVEVFRRPRVAIISTGNELVSPGRELGRGKIYDINTYTIAHAVRSMGAEPIIMGIVRDDINEMRDAVNKALSIGDLVLLSGGTSAGLADLTYKVLDEIGPPGIIIHGLKVKPGKPTVVAVSRDNKLVIGLPGYPSSALMIFNIIVKPILAKMLCTGIDEIRIKARLAIRADGAKGRRALYPVSLVDTGHGVVAYPLPAESGAISTLAFADGYIAIPETVEYLDSGDEVEVTLFTHQYMPANLYIIGSHDLGLDVLIPMLPGFVRARVINVGSMGGLYAVKRGEADVAGLHLVDEETGQYNVPYMVKYNVNNAVLIRGYFREQGLIVPRGNPKNIRGIEDLLRGDVRIVNRNKGAGTRFLLDIKLKEIANKMGVKFEELVRRINGYYYEVKTHTAVAAAVAQGKADAGVGIRAAAAMYGLDFIPLGWESYDFAIPIDRLEKDSVKAFLNMLRSSEFKNALSKLPGYRVPDDIGEVIWKGQ
ncbi:molybdopterin biosynthesis protein [Vulcanisaeta distributa]|uniref:molybdopterin molybdotransferase n=1 Tax=Vulcanisaeta distributa (strain DSM 14429 / JCM 11212 / NBRC 100878 / IC-017) TaxID=572478 RepID=E1QTN9_VULDI|nr:molybdopterin biosynthesis protein [Vulcanisaeta distributa]ADN49754.1 molybdenum cofactor synthesis domain protein [Vulcanisaeta distributa DSM 14429]